MEPVGKEKVIRRLIVTGLPFLFEIGNKNSLIFQDNYHDYQDYPYSNFGTPALLPHLLCWASSALMQFGSSFRTPGLFLH